MDNCFRFILIVVNKENIRFAIKRSKCGLYYQKRSLEKVHFNYIFKISEIKSVY